MFEFIEIENSTIDIAKRDTVFAQFKRIFGSLPPHLKFLGDIDPEILSSFLRYNMSLMKNKKFHKNYFVFIRLYTANKQNYAYCINFNSGLLKGLGYDQSQIEALDCVDNFPVEPALKALAKKSYKAVFNAAEFGQKDLEELYDLGWEIGEIYQVIEHIGLLEKNSRTIKAFLKKD